MDRVKLFSFLERVHYYSTVVFKELTLKKIPGKKEIRENVLHIKSEIESFAQDCKYILKGDPNAHIELLADGKEHESQLVESEQYTFVINQFVILMGESRMQAEKLQSQIESMACAEKTKLSSINDVAYEGMMYQKMYELWESVHEMYISEHRSNPVKLLFYLKLNLQTQLDDFLNRKPWMEESHKSGFALAEAYSNFLSEYIKCVANLDSIMQEFRIKDRSLFELPG